MSIRYRLKRSSGQVHEPIPAHPDAIYRPQHRPTPANIPPIDSGVIAPRIMANNPVVAAPLAAGGSSFSPWWIIGPLLALLAAMTLGALAYIMKKKHDSKKQAQEENEPGKRETNDREANKNKEENLESDENARKLPVENVPLRSVKPDTISKEQQRTAPLSFTARGNSTSSTDPFVSNDLDKEEMGKSTLSAHGLPLTDDKSALSSTRPDSASSLTRHLPINMTHMTKSNSDISKSSDKNNASKIVQNTLANPPLNSPLKHIRSVSTHKTESNYSRNLPPTSIISSTSSTIQQLNQPNNESESNAGKIKSDANLNKKENQSQDFQKTHDDKSPFGQSLTNVGRADLNGPLKAGESNKEFTLPSSRSETNDSNAANKPGDGHVHQPNSPEQHGIGKSPLISHFPTGSKRIEKEKSRSRTNQTQEGKSTSKSSSFNPNLQRQHSLKENTHSSPSDIHKDKPASTLTIHSKHDSLPESNEITSSNSVASAEPTNETNPTSSRPNETSNKYSVQPSDQHLMLNKNDLDQSGSRHIHSFTEELDSTPLDNRLQSQIDSFNPQKLNNRNDAKSDESNTSLTQSDLTNQNKTISLMPNVPQCKTNTSSSDDDYDEVYPIPTNNSPIQQTTSKREKTDKPNSNLNMNASTYRKNRTLFPHRSLTKRFHLKK